ncbi:MAG TPA: DUF3995 domain-containing protein [Nocardioidaceae bacterium]|nr:DUF3995 domain-containing protein [Nocardioidaceae bacterium]
MTARAAWPLQLAALLGMVHGLVSLYWAAGGDWLLSTLGERLVATFADMRWLLAPVGLVKLGFAWLPLLLVSRSWPHRRWWRPLCWCGAAVLIVWGGLNTVVGNLVLAGAVRPHGGYDHAGMVGHAWLWDPLFLAWGLALAVGLVRSRR